MLIDSKIDRMKILLSDNDLAPFEPNNQNYYDNFSKAK